MFGYPKSTCKFYRVGDESTCSNGMRMKIIKYRSAWDIDIKFGDGCIVKHKSYANFKKGFIKYPKKNLKG